MMMLLLLLLLVVVGLVCFNNILRMLRARQHAKRRPACRLAFVERVWGRVSVGKKTTIERRRALSLVLSA